MKAITKLDVLPQMELSITITMTVQEADELLIAMQDVCKWPTRNLKSILCNSLKLARDSYQAKADTSP